VERLAIHRTGGEYDAPEEHVLLKEQSDYPAVELLSGRTDSLPLELAKHGVRFSQLLGLGFVLLSLMCLNPYSADNHVSSICELSIREKLLTALVAVHLKMHLAPPTSPPPP